MIKRLLALLMSLVLVFSLLPVSVFAEEETGEGIVTEEETVPADPVVEETTVQEEISEETENTIQEEIPEETENTTQQEAFEESETFDAAPEEPSESMQELPRYSVPFQVNPLYEGLVTYDDLPEPEEPAQMYAEPVYGTVAEAQAVMREALKNRVANVSVYILDDEYDFYGLYPEVLFGAMNHTGDPTEGDYLLYQYGGCSVESEAMIDPLDNYYVTLTYTIKYYDTLAQEEEMDTAVRALLNQLNLYGKSNYEKIAGIYEWMCKNIYYDYDHLNVSDYKLKYTAYAALINKTAVCQGYANLFYRLALELGVDSRIISGVGITSDGSGAHAWNIVGLDGLYYDADATWDATYQQFAMDYGYEMEYFWFLKNEAEFSQDHVRDEEFTTAAFHAAYPMATADYVYTAPSYVAQGTCGDNLTWTLTEEGVLTISGTGAMTECSATGYPWYSHRKSIKTVIIEDGVTSIGSYAFFQYTDMISATIGDDVISIGEFAFRTCRGLLGVKFGDSVATIGEQAFSGAGLTNVTLPASVTSIGTAAFRCTSLIEIWVEEGNIAYSHDENGILFNKDKTVLVCLPGAKTGVYVIPESVAVIGDYAFASCPNLTGVTIGNAVTDIGDYAFDSCSSLTDVTMGSSVSNIGDYAFYGCYCLQGIELPDSITVIGASAFEGCEQITFVTLESSVTSIGDCAFYDCFRLDEITFKGNAPSFGENAFCNVSATAYYPAGNETWTEEVRQNYGGQITWTKDDDSSGIIIGGGDDNLIPDWEVGSGSWGENATYTLDADGVLTISGTGIIERNGDLSANINTIVIESGITGIGENAFGDATGVTSVVIADSVTSIEQDAFAGCNNLSEITFEGDAPTIEENAFANINAVVYYPAGNETWTEDVRQNYGGTITWEAYDEKAAMVNGVSYPTVAEALAAANSGDTVQLMQDVAEDKLMVLDGVTLDLNGYCLEANYVFAVNGCHIVDNSENNTGLLISDPDNVMISNGNSQLPVWNGEGYIFSPVTYKAKLLSSDHDSLRFAFLPEFKDGATALLEDGCDGNKVSIEVRVSWMTTLGREYRNLVFNERQVDTVVGSGGAFILTFSGFSQLEMDSAIRVEGIVISDTGVSIASPAVEVDVTTAE